MPTQQTEAVAQEQRPPLNVRYKRTDSFDSAMAYGGSFIKASILMQLPWAEAQKPTSDEDRIRLTRLHRQFSRDLEADLGVGDDLTDLSKSEVKLDLDKRRIDIFTEHKTLRDVQFSVETCSRFWDMGRFDMPKVSADEHREMVERGIKLRKDGLFGYHLRCSREACDNHVATCYTQTNLYTAIHDTENRRSRFQCSTDCWIQECGFDDIFPDARSELTSPEPGTVEAEVAKAIGGPALITHPAHIWEKREDFLGEEYVRCTICFGNKKHLEDPDGPCVTDEWEDSSEDTFRGLRTTHPELWKRYVEHLMESADFEYVSDAGESPCET